MKRRKIRIRAGIYLASSCAISAMTAGLALPAYAQGAAAAARDQTIDEVVVTAQRRSQRLVDVPATVTAISGEQLVRSGVTSLTQIGQVSIGTRMANFGVFLQPSIRGITTSVVGPGQENNIAVYVDGFYLPDNTSFGGDLSSVERIEVLKGPQGSLYGRGATGGAILMTTRGPSDQLTGDFSASYGNYDDIRLLGFIAGPISNSLSFSLSGNHRRADGYIKRDKTSNGLIVPGTDGDANPYRSDSVRAKLKWEASSNFDLTLGYHHYKYGDAAGVATSPYAGNPVPPGPLREVRRDRSATNLRPFDETFGDEFMVTADWDIGFGTLTSRTSYADTKSHFVLDQDQTLVPYASSDTFFTRNTFSESLDFATTSLDRWTVLAGVFYFRDKGINRATFVNAGSILTSPSTYINTFNFAGSVEQILRTRSISAYIDVTYEITDKLFLNAGGRYNRDKKKFQALLSGNTLVPAFNLNIPYGPFGVPSTNATFENFIPRASLRYEIADNTNVYASVAKGFKAGTFNALNSFNSEALTRPVDPELATSYEVGVKTQQARFNLAAALYYTTYKDLQVNTLINDPVLGLQASLVNAAAARNYGVEIEGSFSPIENLNIHAGVAYTHARYKSFPNDITPFQSVQNSKGLRIPRAADWTATFRADYTIPDVLGGSINLSGNVYYTSNYAPNLTLVGGPIGPSPIGPYTVRGAVGEEALVQSRYALLNLQATWTSQNDHFTVTAYGENVTNVRYKIYDTAALISTGLGEAVPSYQRVYARPATYGVRLGYRF
jgi:iron complex outermembrane receptor protein